MASPPGMAQLSSSSERLLIATSSVGGAIAVVFILYVVFRMRHGTPLVDVLKLRRSAPLSANTVANTSDYQIQWEQRYSIRSSHHPSLHQSTIASRRQREVPHLPLPVTQRFTSPNAYYRWYWKDKAQPNTPVNAIRSWFVSDATPSPSTTKPESIHLRQGRASVARTRSTNRYSAITFNSSNSRRMSQVWKAPTVSVQSIAESEPRTPTSRSDKRSRLSWSTTWTDASAPPTPKLKMDMKRSSTGSAGKYRPIGAYSSHQMECIEEDGTTPTTLGPGQPSYNKHFEKHKTRGLRTFFDKNSTNSLV